MSPWEIVGCAYTRRSKRTSFTNLCTSLGTVVKVEWTQLTIHRSWNRAPDPVIVGMFSVMAHNHVASILRSVIPSRRRRICSAAFEAHRSRLRIRAADSSLRSEGHSDLE